MSNIERTLRAMIATKQLEIDKQHQEMNGKLRLEITRLKGGLWHLNQVLKLKEKEHKW